MPRRFGLMARGFRQAAERLGRQSAPGVVQHALALPPILLLREARVRTRFFLAAREHDVVFFFFRKDAPQRVVLDATIAFRIAPSAFAAAPLRMLPEGIEHHAVLPPFIVPGSAPEAFAQELGVGPGEVFLLSLPGGVLAVARPESRDKARAGWLATGESGIARLQLDASDATTIAVFLSLTRTIGEWVSAGFEHGREVLFDTAAIAGQSPVIHEIFHRVCESWTEAYNEASVGAEPPPEGLAPAYSVEDYLATVQLRLRPDGMLAHDDDEDPFQLLLTMSISVVNGVPRSRVGIGPPDFLVSGPLFSSFLVALTSEEALDDATELLGIDNDEDRTRLRTFLLAALPKALVFRVKRKARDGSDRDSDLVVSAEQWNGVAATLVICADFDVRGEPDVQVQYVRGAQKVVFSSLPLKKRVEPDSDLIRYCLRLLASLRNWIEALR